MKVAPTTPVCATGKHTPPFPEEGAVNCSLSREEILASLAPNVIVPLVGAAIRKELGVARPRLITVEDAASMFSLSRRKVEDLIKEGKLPAREIGRCVRISLDAAEAFIKTLPRKEGGARTGAKSRKGGA